MLAHLKEIDFRHQIFSAKLGYSAKPKKKLNLLWIRAIIAVADNQIVFNRGYRANRYNETIVVESSSLGDFYIFAFHKQI